MDRAEVEIKNTSECGEVIRVHSAYGYGVLVEPGKSQRVTLQRNEELNVVLSVETAPQKESAE